MRPTARVRHASAAPCVHMFAHTYICLHIRIYVAPMRAQSQLCVYIYACRHQVRRWTAFHSSISEAAACLPACLPCQVSTRERAQLSATNRKYFDMTLCAGST